MSHRRRALAELCELNRKCDRLDKFLKKPPVPMAEEELKLMELQLKSMYQYSELVFKRICLWLEADEPERSDGKD